MHQHTLTHKYTHAPFFVLNKPFNTVSLFLLIYYLGMLPLFCQLYLCHFSSAEVDINFLIINAVRLRGPRQHSKLQTSFKSNEDDTPVIIITTWQCTVSPLFLDMICFPLALFCTNIILFFICLSDSGICCHLIMKFNILLSRQLNVMMQIWAIGAVWCLHCLATTKENCKEYFGVLEGLNLLEGFKMP